MYYFDFMTGATSNLQFMWPELACVYDMPESQHEVSERNMLD